MAYYSPCVDPCIKYGFYFNFSLDGSIELEVKATGIINVYTLARSEAKDTDHEVEVAPRIATQHHQHVNLTLFFKWTLVNKTSLSSSLSVLTL